MEETIDESAQRIAERGREALIERLRGAFEEAAAAHADVLELDEAKLEDMIQRAADRADGLQWRRALATAATDELGIGLGEALGHPAVARAQAILGAPSYEEGLAAIAEGKPPAPGNIAPDADGCEDTAPEAEGPEADAAEEVAGEPEGSEIRVPVVYLDGLPELEGGGPFELLFSDEGLAVVRSGGRQALISFTWAELRGVEVRPARGRVLRRRSSRVVLRATRRSGRFEVRGVTPEELKERLAPALTKLGEGE